MSAFAQNLLIGSGGAAFCEHCRLIQALAHSFSFFG
jgi:hypothetical protein